LLYFA